MKIIIVKYINGRKYVIEHDVTLNDIIRTFVKCNNNECECLKKKEDVKNTSNDDSDSLDDIMTIEHII